MGRKIRSHKLCEKWPLLAMFLSIVAVYLAVQIVPVALMGASESAVYLAVIIIGTSTAFGLSHSVNLLAGASLVMTIIQVVVAMMVGIFLCILFIRTGSILPGMVFHAVNDFFSFATSAKA
ncbi:MAG: CPBP family intramembrane metalloprotease [Firmicutes bacterium]|nr:CPBP family intramembrane metalloprotease [Bacillota bacterium]